MCGIAGLFLRDGAVADGGAERLVREMVERIGYRGPIDRGFLQDGSGSIGMCRLSIIDVAGGHQPIFNEDSSVAVILNGQIYNYLELMAELKEKGHRFRTQSDTEVLVHLYEQEGEAMLSRLNGMFAIAIFDLARRSILLARDRLGVKPVYWAQRADRTVFASELKALLCDAGQPASPDPESIAEFLTLGYIRAPRTPFREIGKLRPGHLLRIDRNGAKEVRWWRIDPRAEHPSYQASCERLRELIDDAVFLRLRSDVPVGTLLSGGLDSSAVTAAHARRNPGPGIQAFTIGYENALFDEVPYAKLVAESVHAEHHVETVRADEAIRLLPLLAWHLDEPSGDSAIVSTYQISRLAASRLRVVLSGVGGDEMFGGYPRYFEGTPAEHVYRRLPRGMRRSLLAPLLGLVSDSWGWRARLNEREQPDRMLWQSSVFDPDHAARLAGRATASVSFAPEYANAAGADAVDRLMLVDLQSYLSDDILHITDRMSMAVSLEVREPLLDHRLIDFAASLPSSYKVDQRRRLWKRCFKDAMAPWLPRPIVERPKSGFGGPVRSWMERGLEAAALRLLADSSAVRRGLLDGAQLRRYLEDRASYDSIRRGARMWNLLSLELWSRIFLDGRGERPSFAL